METNYKISEFNTNNSFHPKNDDQENFEEGNMSFKCKYTGCDRAFRYRSEILRHTLTHTNQRAYVCPHQECGKSFKRSDALATHVRIHTGEKPYECPVGSCQLSFPTKAGLRYHVLKHKNDKLFKCEFPKCDQSFLTLAQLKQHQRGAKVHENLTEQDQQLGTGEYSKTSDSRLRPIEESIFERQPTKRQQLDKPMAKNLASSSLGLSNSLNTERRQDPPQNTKISLEGLSQFDNLHPPPQNIINPNATQYSSVSNEVKASTTANSDDQASLLKKINKILDENNSLKKHVEICQKIIGIYQTNMSIPQNSNPLMKDNTTFKY